MRKSQSSTMARFSAKAYSLVFVILTLWLLRFPQCQVSKVEKADIILFNGKIITVDKRFSIAQAIAIKDGRILGLGTDDDILQFEGDSSSVVNLNGHSVLPGLIDGHAHPIEASQSEYYQKIPFISSVQGLLEWIKNEAKTKQAGEWIIHPRFFVTRLKDWRQITKRELDAVAPDHPVFLNGSFGGMVNTKALRVSQLTDLKHEGIMRDKLTGEATGFIKASAFRLLAIKDNRRLSEDDKLMLLRQMLQRYNAAGITSICSGGESVEAYRLFQKLLHRNGLTVRVFQNIIFPDERKAGIIDWRDSLPKLGFKTSDGNEWLRAGAIKVLLDGGILTGTAYLRQGWGRRAMEVYGIADSAYRGELMYSKNELAGLIRLAADANWKFTAHVTGGGAVDTLLAAFEAVNHSAPLRGKRFSIIHGNFYTPEAIRKMAAMGIIADMQPAWYLKDGDLLNKVLEKDLMRTFHPYASMIRAGIIINAGSDHMIQWDPDSSTNPYNPFLSMWCMISGKAEAGVIVNPETIISRKEAIKMYTINNAYASFEEHLKGSLEAGKLADLVVLSEDILSCPVENIRNIKPLLTMVGGRFVYDSGELKLTIP